MAVEWTPDPTKWVKVDTMLNEPLPVPEGMYVARFTTGERKSEEEQHRIKALFAIVFVGEVVNDHQQLVYQIDLTPFKGIVPMIDFIHGPLPWIWGDSSKAFMEEIQLANSLGDVGG